MSRIAPWAMAFLLAFALTGCQTPGLPADAQRSGGAPARVETALPAGELAPEFALKTLAGHTVQLSALRGRWVLVNFWATWCTPCRTEMPYLDSLAAQKPDLLTVLAVNMREPEREIAAFVEELELRLPILLAPDDDVLLAYSVRGLPLSFLIDPTGMLVQRIAGPLTPGLVEAQIDHVP